MKKLILTLVSFSFIYSSLAQDKTLGESDSLKLLVVTGGPTMRYQIDLVPTSFYSLFMGYDNLIWDHATQDEAAFQTDGLNNYDVVLMYNRSDSLSNKSKQNLKEYLESGKGLVVLHHALGSYNNWEWWWKEVIGGKYQMKECDTLSKSDFKLGEVINMLSQKDHAITNELGGFTLMDETYRNLWISKEVEILYWTDNPNSDGPTVWISPFEKSKIIIIQPGHANSAHLDINYKKLIYLSILWASSE